MGRFFSTYAINTGFQYITEIFPTCLRGQGVAMATLFSSVAQIASPYIVYSSVLHPDAPFYIIGILGLLGMLPGIFLPETAGISLPNTMEEAKNLGLNANFFWMPLMNEKHRFKTDKSADVALKTEVNEAFQQQENSPNNQLTNRPVTHEQTQRDNLV